MITPKKPNLFIAGAPKAATTSLAYYLSQHPNIQISNPKEPHFFATDLPNYRKYTELDDYLSLFRKDQNQTCYLGDASPNYLRSNESIPNILQFNASAVFIVILRNPVQLVESWHAHLVYLGEEKRRTLTSAWNNTQPADYTAARESVDVDYRNFAALGDQLERLLACVPRSNLYLTTFDEITKRPDFVYAEIISWLNLPAPETTPDFIPLNQRKVAKNRLFQILVNHGPTLLRPIWERIRAHDKLREYIRRLMLREKTSIPHSTRHSIQTHYLPQIEKLEELTAIDLEHWKNE